ncbi:hypothetical protein [Bosea sp. NBC_00550]|uniref:hypothetical protein n=1 Tax=Bosea sp. NBC_00550 TaxID=2969621 RepID=UPI0022308DFF|nr:hypothetical protein [Bosea sp. NBC_00550]UZF93025.1 hypothetical protein NWE53_02065 [Bosea sp. NBC_00550]
MKSFIDLSNSISRWRYFLIIFASHTALSLYTKSSYWIGYGFGWLWKTMGLPQSLFLGFLLAAMFCMVAAVIALMIITACQRANDIATWTSTIMFRVFTVAWFLVLLYVGFIFLTYALAGADTVKAMTDTTEGFTALVTLPAVISHIYLWATPGKLAKQAKKANEAARTQNFSRNIQAAE